MRVLLVHGTFDHSACFLLLARRLEQHALNSVTFAPKMQDFGALFDAITMHLDAQSEPCYAIGHGIGGLLVQKAMTQRPKDIARAVFLGTPVANTYRLMPKGFDDFLGKVAPNPATLGAIAGNKEGVWSKKCLETLDMIKALRGMHALDRALKTPLPSDGSVLIEETQIEGASHLVLGVSHIGLLTDADVAWQSAYFLRHGRFWTHD